MTGAAVSRENVSGNREDKRLRRGGAAPDRADRNGRVGEADPFT